MYCRVTRRRMRSIVHHLGRGLRTHRRLTRRCMGHLQRDRLFSTNTKFVPFGTGLGVIGFISLSRLDQLHSLALHLVVDIDVALGDRDALVTGKTG